MVSGFSDQLQNTFNNILYRWYENIERYDDAANVVAQLLERAQQREDQNDVAVLTNNLGYEYLLSHRWELAAPYFHRAASLFERLGKSCEVLNMRSNSIICEVETHGIECLALKRKELIELARVMRKKQDWRARKPLILLARLNEHVGNYQKAIVYARLAVNVGKGIPSRHHLEDKVYLSELQSNLVNKDSILLENDETVEKNV